VYYPASPRRSTVDGGQLEILAITLHDLRFRFRQFLITVAGASLVFAMGLLLSGMAAGFSAEIRGTVRAENADSWVISSQASGRLGALPAIPESSVAAVAREPASRRAAPLVVGGQAAKVGAKEEGVVMIGAVPGRLGSATVAKGRPVRRSGEAVVGSRLSAGIGERFSVAGVSFVVVGTVGNRTMFAWDACHLRVTSRRPAGSLPGPAADRGVARRRSSAPRAGRSKCLFERGGRAGEPDRDGIRRLVDQQHTCAHVGNRGLHRGCARLRLLAPAHEGLRGAEGAWSLLGLPLPRLAVQAVIVAMSAAAIAALISTQMTGLFAQPIAIPGSAFIVLPVAALLVGILASLAALRRAVAADPSAAFAAA